MPAEFRIRPVEVLDGPSAILAYRGSVQQYADELWTDVDPENPDVLLQWPRAGDTDVPKQYSDVSKILLGEDPEACDPPSIVQLNVTDITTLSIGSAALVTIVSARGVVTAPSAITVEDDITILNVSNLTGRVTLHLTDVVTFNNTPIDDIVVLPGTHRICGNLRADDTVVQDWEDIRYVNGNTHVVFTEGYVGDVRLYSADITKIKVYKSGYDYIALPGEYPVLQLNNKDVLVDCFPIIREGHTQVNVASVNNDYVNFLVPWWMYQLLAYQAISKGLINDGVSLELDQHNRTIDWYSITGKPATSPNTIDQKIAELSTFKVNALSRFETIEGKVALNGIVFEGPQFENAHKLIAHDGDGKYLIDVEQARSVRLAPDQVYTVALTNRPDYAHTVLILLVNGGAYASTWAGVFNATRNLHSSGYDLIAATSIPVGEGFQTFFNLLTGTAV